jgi:hypothetical protein
MNVRNLRVSWSIVGASMTPCVLLAACGGADASLFAPMPDAGAEAPRDASSGEAAFGDATPSDVAAPGTTLLYANTGTTLFRVDADDPRLAVTRVGDFDCVGAGEGKVPLMTDIAVDHDGRLYGVSTRAVFLDMTVDGGTVQCAAKRLPLVAAPDFFAAAFAPKGTIDPVAETLVAGGAAGTLWAVDTSNGSVALVGNFGTVPADDGNGHAYPPGNVGKQWELSGDVVFFENGGNPVGFAAVRDCPNPPYTANCSTTDTLVEVDPKRLSRTAPTVVTRALRGQVVKASNCADPTRSSYGGILGVAAYRGDVIGFARLASGASATSPVVRVDNASGQACLVTDDSAVATGGWWGAGVTTAAPVTAPPPR